MTINHTPLEIAVRIMYDDQELKEIITHGCVSGCASGLIYYQETTAFHDKYEAEIWELINEYAEAEGQTTLEYISGFAYNRNNPVYDITQLKNMLAWFAVEEVARKLLEENEK